MKLTALTCMYEKPILRPHGGKPMIRRILRFVAHVRAALGGYFWLDCPICCEPFGGNEPHGRLMESWSSGRLVCERCIPKADWLNRDLMERLPRPTKITEVL